MIRKKCFGNIRSYTNNGCNNIVTIFTNFLSTIKKYTENIKMFLTIL